MTLKEVSSERLWRWLKGNSFIIGLLSLIWFVARTGRKPSRSIYPCQQVAALNGQIWLATYVFPVLAIVRKPFSSLNSVKLALLGLGLIAVVGIASLSLFGTRDNDGNEPVATPSPSPTQSPGIASILTLKASTATSQPASDIFAITGTSGNDGGFSKLLDLMGSHGLLFYKSGTSGKNKGPSGLIDVNDVVIVKVNCQWDERGGTNTDLLKELIKAVTGHPDGFVGEVIVADNGQAQGGSSGHGGSLNWANSNAEDRSQSAQRVVDSFAYSSSFRVSTYLWDTITEKRVAEYSEGDMEDGYVVNATANERTRIMVSYPKFRAKSGTYVSFKMGIWDPQKRVYDGDRLKVINVPVMKSHSVYGLTASVKHYQGVVSDKLTASLGSRSHNTIAWGGMGTEMVETRFPVLNIIDAIWVNAVPLGGPATSYSRATNVKVIAASTDPVALDYWAAKRILCAVCEANGWGDTSSMDPDNRRSGEFGGWLRLSMEELNAAGYGFTCDEDRISVHVN